MCSVGSRKVIKSRLTPHADFIVVSSSHEQGARGMESDTTDGTCGSSVLIARAYPHIGARTFMLLKPVDKHTHPIVPKLHAPIVQRRREQWLRGVESEPWALSDVSRGRGGQRARRTLDAVALRFEFREHHRHRGGRRRARSSDNREKGGEFQKAPSRKTRLAVHVLLASVCFLRANEAGRSHGLLGCADRC